MDKKSSPSEQVMADFSQRFEKIYRIFLERAAKDGLRTSKAALAKYLGASSGKLQKWEAGSLPQQDDLQLLHRLFGLSYEWLITGEGEPFDAPPMTSQFDTDRVAELEKENYALKTRLEQTEWELREERSLNRQLTSRLLAEGSADKDTARAVGHE